MPGGPDFERWNRRQDEDAEGKFGSRNVSKARQMSFAFPLCSSLLTALKDHLMNARQPSR